ARRWEWAVAALQRAAVASLVPDVATAAVDSRKSSLLCVPMMAIRLAARPSPAEQQATLHSSVRPRRQAPRQFTMPPKPLLEGGLALLGSASAFVAAPQEASAPSLRGTSLVQSQAQAAASGSSLSALAAGGAVAAAAVAASRPGRQTRSTILPTTVVPVKESRVTRKALDQSSRYADLSLDEATLIKNGKHVLVAYIMKPKAGYDYL
ncbi:rbcL, partial [Symbiodinium necroappetens]